MTRDTDGAAFGRREKRKAWQRRTSTTTTTLRTPVSNIDQWKLRLLWIWHTNITSRGCEHCDEPDWDGDGLIPFNKSDRGEGPLIPAEQLTRTANYLSTIRSTPRILYDGVYWSRKDTRDDWLAVILKALNPIRRLPSIKWCPSSDSRMIQSKVCWVPLYRASL